MATFGTVDVLVALRTVPFTVPVAGIAIGRSIVCPAATWSGSAMDSGDPCTCGTCAVTMKSPAGTPPIAYAPSVPIGDERPLVRPPLLIETTLPGARTA